MTTNATASPAVLQRLSQLLDSVRKWESDPAISSDVAWAYKMCADALDGQIRCLTAAPVFNVRIPDGMTVTGMTVVDAQHQDGEAVAWLATDPNVTPDPAEAVTNDPSLALHWRADGYVVTSLYTHPAPAAPPGVASFEVFAREFGINLDPFPECLRNQEGFRFKYKHANDAWKAWVAAHPAPAPVDDAMVERALHAFTNHPIPRGNYGENSERDMMRAALTAAMLPKAPTGVTAAIDADDPKAREEARTRRDAIDAAIAALRVVPDGTVPKLTQQQAIILTGYTGFMCCSSFADFKEDLSRRVGRPVFTHEAGRLARPLYRDDFLKLIPKATLLTELEQFCETRSSAAPEGEME